MNTWNHITDMDHLRRRSEKLVRKGRDSTTSSVASGQNDPRVERNKALYEGLGATNVVGKGRRGYRR